MAHGVGGGVDVLSHVGERHVHDGDSGAKGEGAVVAARGDVVNGRIVVVVQVVLWIYAICAYMHIDCTDGHTFLLCL